MRSTKWPSDSTRVGTTSRGRVRDSMITTHPRHRITPALVDSLAQQIKGSTDVFVSARQAKILVVADGASAPNSVTRLLNDAGYQVATVAGESAALEYLASETPDAAIVELTRAESQGTRVCQQAKASPLTRLVPVVLVSDAPSAEEQLQWVQAGADDYFCRPLEPEHFLARVAILVRMKQYTDDLEPAVTVMMTLCTLIESDRGYSEGHCHRMANHATALGRRLGLASDDLRLLYRGAFLHDIGMLAIPTAVLMKPVRLSPDEYALVRSHTTIGDSLLSNFRSLSAVRPIVRCHHERWNGSGYPSGLQGDAIPLLAQIVGLVDSFEAMTTARPYQATLTPEGALEVLRREVLLQWWRGDLVEHLAAIVQRGALARDQLR